MNNNRKRELTAIADRLIESAMEKAERYQEELLFESAMRLQLTADEKAYVAEKMGVELWEA